MAAPPDSQDNIEAVDAWLANVLRFGTIAAAMVIALAGVVYLMRHGSDVPQHQNFRGEPAELKSAFGILQEALHGGSRGLLMAGMLLLIATPIARVAGALLAFALRRDVTYVILSGLVLAGLLFGLLAG